MPRPDQFAQRRVPSFGDRLKLGAQLAVITVAVGGLCFGSFKAGGVWMRAYHPVYVFPPDNTPYSEAELQRSVEREVSSRCGQSVDPSNVRILAMTVWGEARSEGPRGMRAVAHVIDNRVKAFNGAYGKTLREVILKDYQFSAWNQGDPNLSKMSVVEALDPNGDDWASWVVAQKIAEDVLSGHSVDPTQGRRYYHTSAVQPGWSNGATGALKIGNHIFYYDAALKSG